jgi:hypothetical protein
LPYLVLSNRLNRRLQLTYLLILQRVVRILLIEFLDELPEILLLLLDIDVVALEVLVFLLCQHTVQFLI